MNPVELRELMKDAEVRGQYLASIRHRGKDVLLGDIEKLIEIMIDEAVEIEERKTENAILNQQLSAKIISEQNIINAFGISGEGAHSKLVIEYVHGLVADRDALAAENAALKDVVGLTVNNLYASGYEAKQNSMHPWESLIFEGEKAMSTPATNAFTAELRAQGADHVASVAKDIEEFDVAALAKSIADDLRAGRKG